MLDGGAGTDTMTGGAGNDTYVVDVSATWSPRLAGQGTDTVQSTVTHALRANVENLTLTGHRRDQRHRQCAGQRADRQPRQQHARRRRRRRHDGGGRGNDTYVVDNAGDLVIEQAGEGTDTVPRRITYTLTANVENLTLTGTANLNGTGNALDNMLTGTAGNNLLDGGLGDDTMIGGAGDDTYVVDNAGDLVIEAAGGGIDTVLSSVSYTLRANVEKLVLTGSATSTARAIPGPTC